MASGPGKGDVLDGVKGLGVELGVAAQPVEGSGLVLGRTWRRPTIPVSYSRGPGTVVSRVVEQVRNRVLGAYRGHPCVP